MRQIADGLRNRRGQAMVEFALALPIFLWLVCGMIDFGRVFHELIVVSYAAREGARSAAVRSDDAAIREAVRAASVNLHSEDNPVNVAINPENTRIPQQPVTITVTHQVDILTPLISSLFDPNPFTVTGTAVMRVE
jgi:Flp pilus assembly protein TadG